MLAVGAGGGYGGARKGWRTELGRMVPDREKRKTVERSEEGRKFSTGGLRVKVMGLIGGGACTIKSWLSAKLFRRNDKSREPLEFPNSYTLTRVNSVNCQKIIY